MEVIRIDGYTEDEKVAIARHHLLPRQLERNGLREDEVAVTDDALRAIVGDYTREAGVRNLERELGKLLRKVATTIAAGDAASPGRASTRTTFAPTSGGQRFFFEAAERTAVPGCRDRASRSPAPAATCLFIEATREDGEQNDGLTLTGQLGDVMKESAQIALSLRAIARLGARDRSRRGSAAGSTSTCPRARSRRTGRAPASR